MSKQHIRSRQHLWTAPRLYSAIDYFKTFDPKPSDKQILHGHWINALNILLDSREQLYSDQGKRLRQLWYSPDNGLGAFWQERDVAETASDVEDTARNNIRKHSIRSAERNVLDAIHNLDNESRSKRAKREKKKNLGKKNADPDDVAVDHDQSSHIPGSCVRQQEQNDSVTQDSKLQSITSPAAPDIDQLPEGSESQIARFDVIGEPILGSQENSGTDVASEKDTADKSAHDDELLSQKSTASECERSALLSKGIFYLTGDGSKDCSKDLWTPWFVNGKDLAPTLWKYRERVINAAQRLAPLESSVERLAVNHIYLFEQNDTDSSLFDIIGLKDWRT
ncbi:hypothetical protein BGZ65_006789, partial [Modicella reniformis]